MSDKVWFCKQRITNACGTVGLLHALINAEDHVGMDGWLKKFAANCRDKDPETRASILEGDSEVSSGRCGCLLRSQMELRGLALYSTRRRVTQPHSSMRVRRMQPNKGKRDRPHSMRSSSCTLSRWFREMVVFMSSMGASHFRSTWVRLSRGSCCKMLLRSSNRSTWRPIPPR